MRSSYENWLLKAVGATLGAAALFCGAGLHAQQPGDRAGYLLVDQTGERPEPPAAFWIGVACDPLPEALRSQLGLSKGQGVLVQDVVEGSPATEAGLKRYDVILALDDQQIGGAQELSQAVKQTQGKEASVRYLRSGKEATVTVKPTERPAQIGFSSGIVPEGDQQLIQKWLELLRPGAGPYPGQPLRFFHPGMVLPPGAPADLSLPDDVSVTISKHGKEPAKISVRQGDRSWEVAEGKLDELPDEVRLPIERMLGGPRFDINVLEEGQPAAKRTRETWPGVRGNRRSEAGRPEGEEDRLDRQLDEIRDQLRQLQKAMDDLQSKNGAGKR